MAFDIANAAAGAASGILGMAFGGINDERQLRQQKELQKQQIEGNKQMMDYSQTKQMDMWNKTNSEAQMKHLKAAGLNPGLMYGMSGPGGGTTGAPSGSVDGGKAADAASTQNAATSMAGMGMQMAAQTQLLQAQKENVEADTANKKAGAENVGVKTEGEKMDNKIKSETIPDQIKTIQETANKALADAVQSQQQQVITEETMKDQIKTIQQEAIGKLLANEGISLENRKKQAEITIKQFEAELAKQGIASNTPWYVKFITDLLGKYGLKL